MAGETLQFSTPQIQGYVNIIYYIVLGLIALFVVGYIFWKIYQKSTYKYSVDVYKKVGDAKIQTEDIAKQVKSEGSYFMHYAGLKKFSPVIDPKYMRIKQKKMFGIFPKATLAFSIFLHGESIFPMEVHDNPGLVPINLDLFNYMQQRIKAIQAKYVRTSQIMQMLPYVAVGGIIIMFIVGMIFYTKHVEAISANILGTAQSAAQAILEQSGAAQVIGGT